MNKPHILLTNDDGIDAPGLWHLWRSLIDFADITIVAPAAERSGAALAVTLRTPLHIDPVRWEKETPAWKISGTPADCIRMALSTMLPKAPDIIVSGINRGSNAGREILYSGTVGGVIAGAMRNVQGISLSCAEFYTPDYASVEKHVYPLVRYLLDHPLAGGTFLNVNFPASKEIKGFKLARQGMSYWIENPEKRHHPEGGTYYWLGGRWEDHPEPEGSDITWLKEGYVSIVPVYVNELTDQAAYRDRKVSIEGLFTG